MPDTRTVLIVDDDRELADGLRVFLQRHGFRCVLANNGLDAQRAIREERPDLVVMDMMMPRMGGYPVLESLQGRTDAPPVIMMTANEGARHKAYAEHLGVIDYLRKPFDMQRLLESVQRVLPGADPAPIDVIQIQGSFDDALSLVRQIGERLPIAIVNSINPHRIQGQKTGAFEIIDQLGGRAPDWMCLPVGNAGNVTAYWKGYREYHAAGKAPNLPRLRGVQPAGSAPLVLGPPVDQPETVATAIRIGRPARGEEALLAAEESRGAIVAVSDDQILSMQKRLASEGVWCEPASAAGAAGLLQETAAGRLDVRGLTVVCVVTGHGMKDPAIGTEQFAAPPDVPATLEALAGLLAR